jgi:3-methyladenine DNA glycosylase/8-oxoguanine DNA glycosylase
LAGTATDWSATLALRGAGGEPVDLRRTVDGHGLTTLPPMTPHADQRGFGIVLRLPRGRPLAVRVREAGKGRVRVSGPATSAPRRQAALDAVRHVLRLDEDLSAFYELVLADDELSWARTGAGRMMRSQTVFEDVVKTICTTNCAWSGTVRMVNGLVDGLGEQAIAHFPRRPRWRRRPSPSTRRTSAPATAARTCARSPRTSRPARWTSKRWPPRGAASCLTKSSRNGCWRSPASGPMPRRTS